MFSFAIVMSELASLRVPYADHLKDEDGNWVASWEKVVEMTKKNGLRPTLPEGLDPEFKALIEDCWNPEASLRPSFPVILVRLQGLGVPKSTRDRKKTLLTSSGAAALCRALNDLLWHHGPGEWDDRRASALIAEGAVVKARDSTLNKILGSETGPAGAKALAWLMFGGVEDGVEIQPEPILDADIILSPDGLHALLNAQFALIAPQKIKQWRAKDTREVRVPLPFVSRQ